MKNKLLERLATRLQQHSSRVNAGRTLTLYIICCAIGAIACGYVIFQGVYGRTRVLHVSPITPPVLLYDCAPDTIIHHFKK